MNSQDTNKFVSSFSLGPEEDDEHTSVRLRLNDSDHHHIVTSGQYPQELVQEYLLGHEYGPDDIGGQVSNSMVVEVGHLASTEMFSPEDIQGYFLNWEMNFL